MGMQRRRRSRCSPLHVRGNPPSTVLVRRMSFLCTFSSFLLRPRVSTCLLAVSNDRNNLATGGSSGGIGRGVRCFTSSAPIVSPDGTLPSTSEQRGGGKKEENDLLDPSQLCNGAIPYPKSLSPSSAMEFKACPQSYLIQYLYGIRSPTNEVLAKGSMCHSALERLFDLPAPDRTLDNLHNLLRVSWAEKRLTDQYRGLFELPPVDQEEEGGATEDGCGETSGQEEADALLSSSSSLPPPARRDVEAERLWGQSALNLLSNYVALEDPRGVPPPNPIEREVWLNATLAVDAAEGVTGYASSVSAFPATAAEAAGAAAAQGGGGDSGSNDTPTFLVRGIVDRIDWIRSPNGSDAEDHGCLRIVDYKTGKAPNFKYSSAVNERIANENFWQLKVYALLLRETIAKGTAPVSIRRNALDLRMLRLMYLTSVDGSGRYLDLDLGATEEKRDAELQSIHSDLAGIWTSILSLVSTQDPRAFVHCDRPFCFCHKVRPRFVPGTVWERQPSA